MFDQLKDLNNLRKQAAELQKQLESEKVEGLSRDGLVRIVLNGKNDMLEVELKDQAAYDRKEMAQAFKQAYDSAQSQLQKILANKFKGMI